MCADCRDPLAEARPAGLLVETATIGTRAGWAERLRERGHALRGHRLVRARTEQGRAGP